MKLTAETLAAGLEEWACQGGDPEVDARALRSFIAGLCNHEKGREHVYAAMVAAKKWSFEEAELHQAHGPTEGRRLLRVERAAHKRLLAACERVLA